LASSETSSPLKMSVSASLSSLGTYSKLPSLCKLGWSAKLMLLPPPDKNSGDAPAS
jgi:hypothetical protein